jgi:competence protein ComEA
MSFYRIFFVTATIALATPVFAADPANSMLRQNPPANAEMQTTTSLNQPSVNENKINVNRATAKDLMKIKGLNAAKSRAIVAYRKKHGDFKSLDDLAKVKGFKRMNATKMQHIQNQMSLD